MGQSVQEQDGVPLLPIPWCKNAYKCQVAEYEPPDDYFAWIHECYTLLRGGYKIESNSLSLTEWKDIGLMRNLLENRQQEQQLSNLSLELVKFVASLRRR